MRSQQIMYNEKASIPARLGRPLYPLKAAILSFKLQLLAANWPTSNHRVFKTETEMARSLELSYIYLLANNT